VVTKLDRLGRSLEHLTELSNDLQHREVDLVVLDYGIDTSTAVGRMFFQILGFDGSFSTLSRDRNRRHGRRCGIIVRRYRPPSSTWPGDTMAAALAVSTVIEGVSLVFRGFFNPAIFSPAWFLHQDLISADDFDSAEVEMINASVASFSAGWLTCQVTPDRLQLKVVDAAYFELVRDVAVGILMTLPHTPIAALGINCELHLQVRDLRVWHAIGDYLLPKTFWDETLHLAGMRSVAVEGIREGFLDGRVIVQVEPSSAVANGVFLAHNDHYALTRRQEPIQRREDFGSDMDIALLSDVRPEKLSIATEVLTDEWADSMRRARNIFARIKELARALADGESR
jgi:hypothetical protein